MALIGRFMSKATAGQSMCHQMIMGAGKTTVVAPTLGLLLADGRRLVMEVSVLVVSATLPSRSEHGPSSVLSSRQNTSLMVLFATN